MKIVPNLLSGLRIALAPFIFLALWRRDFSTALWLFAAAAVTDWFDGYFARRLGAESRFGRVLDPIADKVLLSGSYLTLGLAGSIPAWVMWIVLGRDVFLVAGALVLSATTGRRREFPPSWWGKVSTGFQIGFIFAVLLDVRAAAQVLMWVVVVLTMGSGIDYAIRGARQPVS